MKKYLIAMYLNGKVEIITTSFRPEKCLVIMEWFEYETQE